VQVIIYLKHYKMVSWHLNLAKKLCKTFQYWRYNFCIYENEKI